MIAAPLQSAIAAAQPTVPRHVAVIMDGNGRWAQSRGLPRIKGHEQGSKAVGECVEGCRDAGVEYLTLYAFSSENWKRPAAEVQGLMLLLERFLDQKTNEMIEKGVQLRAIGRLEDLPRPCHDRLRRAIDATAANDKLVLTLALSYSGRSEIVDAVRELVRAARAGEIAESDVTPDLIAAHLYTRGVPDPDLLIRTSGELRLSNFLLWQLSYTEIHVTQKLWPEFTKADLLAALDDYSKRHRRYGGV
ncbi:MAG: isoprenyl transferase [Terrimicrobiaceae bacterium]|nr:isoprenyl transferase [Terrimicrobiaceae bacterium]